MKSSLSDQLFQFILERRSTTARVACAPFSRYTKQGIYQALRRLRDEEKILWSKRGKVEVHLLWVQQEIDRLAEALPEKHMVFEQFSGSPVTYTAQTLTELERVYGQVFVSLIRMLGGSVHNYLFYDVHNYTYVHTSLIVDWYIEYIKRHGGETYLLVGSQSPLDEVLRKRNKMKEIHVYCTPPKWPVALSIFGEYVISIRFHKKVLESFEKIFNTETIETAKPLLRDLYTRRYPSKITVEKNPEKAARLAKTFHKYFHIKG